MWTYIYNMENLQALHSDYASHSHYVDKCSTSQTVDNVAIKGLCKFRWCPSRPIWIQIMCMAMSDTIAMCTIAPHNSPKYLSVEQIWVEMLTLIVLYRPIHVFWLWHLCPAFFRSSAREVRLWASMGSSLMCLSFTRSDLVHISLPLQWRWLNNSSAKLFWTVVQLSEWSRTDRWTDKNFNTRLSILGSCLILAREHSELMTCMLKDLTK